LSIELEHFMDVNLIIMKVVLIHKPDYFFKKIFVVLNILIYPCLPGCREENYPPEAELEVYPTSGEVPLDVRIKSKSRDLNNDITTYKLYINNEVTHNTTPTDITKTFESPGTYKIYEEVIDSKGLSDKSYPISVEAYLGPYIDQSASLSNDVEINYSATLHKINNAELKVNKNGELFLTEQITDNNQTGTDYEKTFTYSSDGFTKGNYEFVLKSENLEKRNSVQIPNYKPTGNFSGLKLDFLEEEEINLNLPVPTDKNPEDNPVSFTNAKSLDGKTKATLNGYNLKIEGLPNFTGNYQVELEFGNSAGGLEKAVLIGNIIEDTRMKVNPFVSTNENGAEYDLLTTRTKRDNYVQEKLNEDWADAYHIYPRLEEPFWACQEYAKQLMINFHGFPGLEGYSGENIDSIYYHQGTLKDNGKYGLPGYYVVITATFGHAMNAILTGDNVTNWNDWNFIEPQRDQINVQPGQAYMPMNASEVRINYSYVNENDGLLDGVPILKFKIENGTPTLIWINEPPYEPESNLNIIKQRGN